MTMTTPVSMAMPQRAMKPTQTATGSVDGEADQRKVSEGKTLYTCAMPPQTILHPYLLIDLFGCAYRQLKYPP